MTKRLLAILGLVTVAGCAERRPPSALDLVAREPMQAGIGLGELKLLQTTLGSFTKKFGEDKAVVSTDQGGAKIDFISAGLAFIFRGDPVCVQGLSAHVSAGAQQDVNGFLLQNPNCETMLLESIAAYVPAMGEPLYEGETVEGIGLNEARELAERAYQATVDAVNALETGEPMPERPPANEIRHPGIRIHLGKDAEGREVVRRLEIIPR